MNKYTYMGPPPIFTINGIPVADDIARIVHGGRGAYVEFDALYDKNLHIPAGQEWRLSSEKAYYVEYRTFDGIKVYYQKKTVDYADYKVGKWYISPKYLMDFGVVGKYDDIASK